MQARWGQLAHNAHRSFTQAVETYQHVFNHATAVAAQEFRKLGTAAPRAGRTPAFAVSLVGLD